MNSEKELIKNILYNIQLIENEYYYNAEYKLYTYQSTNKIELFEALSYDKKIILETKLSPKYIRIIFYLLSIILNDKYDILNTNILYDNYMNGLNTIISINNLSYYQFSTILDLNSENEDEINLLLDIRSVRESNYKYLEIEEFRDILYSTDYNMLIYIYLAICLNDKYSYIFYSNTITLNHNFKYENIEPTIIKIENISPEISIFDNVLQYEPSVDY